MVVYLILCLFLDLWLRKILTTRQKLQELVDLYPGQSDEGKPTFSVRDDTFLLTKNVSTRLPFITSMFARSPLSHCPMGISINQRKVNYDAFKEQKKSYRYKMEQLLKVDSDSLTNRRLFVYPYQIDGSAPVRKEVEINQVDIESAGLENYSINNPDSEEQDDYNKMIVTFHHLGAIQADKNCYYCTMVLLNKPFDKEAEYPDWNEVIKATDDFYSNKDLESFLKSCELPSDIIMDLECDKMVNYRRWNRFYFLTGSVLFDTVEGGHRCTFAMRTCFGYPLYNALPLKDMCMNSDLKTRGQMSNLSFQHQFKHLLFISLYL